MQAPPSLAGIRADGAIPVAFPAAFARRPVALTGTESQDSSTYRCGGSAGWAGRERPAPLLPVELQHVNHTASTNAAILGDVAARSPYNRLPMSNQSKIDQIAERVERLLVRHAELQRTNALLTSQVEALTHERDSLKSRLSAARARVDALLDRLPEAGVGNSSKDAS